jgi:hypothetical protein
MIDAPRLGRKSTETIGAMSKSDLARRQAASLGPREEEPVMRYACLVYFDPKKAFDRSPESEVALRDGYAYLEELKASGRLVTDGALQMPDQTVTLKVRDGKMSSTDGPFMETKEMLAGFLVVEARDLNEALRIAAAIPLARIGTVEVRPFVDFSKPRPSA